MRRIILNLAVSVDGYIARMNHEVDFLPQPNPEAMKPFNKFLSRIDTIIMGSGSYDIMCKFGEYPFKDKKTIVMTSKNFEPIDNFLFTNEDIETLMNKQDGNVWLFGGAKLIQDFTKRDLIDEYQITLTPTLIGSGIPLFLPFDNDIKLQLERTEVLNNNVTLIYTRAGGK